jgi:hypothetical protein
VCMFFVKIFMVGVDWGLILVDGVISDNNTERRTLVQSQKP